MHQAPPSGFTSVALVRAISNRVWGFLGFTATMATDDNDYNKRKWSSLNASHVRSKPSFTSATTATL